MSAADDDRERFVRIAESKDALTEERSGAMPVSYTHLTLPTTPYV